MIEQLTPPADVTVESAQRWFATIADRILRQSRLIVSGQEFRPAEIEFYYHSPRHPDPFTHRNPLQDRSGRWYFHRIGNSYRGGTFKGLDLTFGDGVARGGILLRSLRQEHRSLSGPCVLVDEFLRMTNTSTVAELDEQIASFDAWDTRSPIHFAADDRSDERVYSSSRVGLSLKKAQLDLSRKDFLLRKYRFFTQPASIAKGRSLVVVALHRAGHSTDEIREISRCPLRTVNGYLSLYQQGLQRGSFEDYIGKDLTSADLCVLEGIADRATR